MRAVAASRSSPPCRPFRAGGSVRGCCTVHPAPHSRRDCECRTRGGRGAHLLHWHPLKQHHAPALVAGRQVGAIAVKLHRTDDVRCGSRRRGGSGGGRKEPWPRPSRGGCSLLLPGPSPAPRAPAHPRPAASRPLPRQLTFKHLLAGRTLAETLQKLEIGQQTCGSPAALLACCHVILGLHDLLWEGCKGGAAAAATADAPIAVVCLAGFALMAQRHTLQSSAADGCGGRAKAGGRNVGS